MNAGQQGGQEPTEEQLRAAYEAEIKKLTVGDVLAQSTISLVNLAGRKLGIAEGTEDERDLRQSREAIDAIRTLLPMLEAQEGMNVAPIRDALSQLQLAYAREMGAAGGAEPGARPADASGETAPAGGAEPGGAGAKPGEKEGPGPAQASGRLWVPGS